MTTDPPGPAEPGAEPAAERGADTGEAGPRPATDSTTEPAAATPAAGTATATIERPTGAAAVAPTAVGAAPLAPPPLPPVFSLRMARWASAWVVVAAIGVGVLGDLALRAELTGIVVAILFVATAALLLASGLLASTQSKVLVALAPVFGVWPAIRASEWLLPLDLIAAAGLLLLGVGLARDGSVFDLRVRAVLTRAFHAFAHGCAAPQLLLKAVPRRTGPRSASTVAAVRGVLLAAPVLLLLGVLLVSGDAVFASFVTVDVDLGVDDVVGHAFLVAFATWVMLWLLRVAGAEPPSEPAAGRPRLGPLEATIVLGSVIALFGAFAVAQLVAVIGGDDYVQRTTGVTYAEYARSGFFQLLWVAALTVAALLALRAATDVARAPRRLAVLFAVTCALTLLIVTVAIRRLALYQDAYGMTMLRLYCTLFAVWIGVVLVLLAAWLTRRWTRAWLPAAASVAGLALLLGLNVANPEAIVAETNLQRESTLLKDTRYVARLSDDAVPTVVALLPTLTPAERNEALALLCRPSRLLDDPDENWTRWSLAESRADAARATVCLGPSGR